MKREGRGGRGRKGVRRGTRHLSAAEPTPNTRKPPHAAFGRHEKVEHVKDAAQDVAEDAPQNAAQGFWARVFAQLATR